MKKIAPISYKPKDVSFDTIRQYLNKSFKNNHLTNWGPCVIDLENSLRDKLHILQNKSVICTSSGTTALHALIAGITKYYKQKLRFAVQAFTFPSSIQQILANSIVIDIDESGGLNLSHINVDYIDGIVVTNCFGNLVDIDKYKDWCDKNNKILIFDNASTPSSFWKGKNSINYGNGAIVSLHHTKPIGFGEGGFVVVDSIYEENVRECVDQGFGRPNKTPQAFYAGSNYKMSDISAAFILSYLEQYHKIREAHVYLYQKMKKLINHIDGIKLFPCSIPDPFCSHIALLVNNGIEDNFFYRKGVAAKKYYRPLSSNSPISTRYYNDIICLPLHIELTEDDLLLYIDLIRIHFE
jgi:dTDP-4-amino-4,6-dideoxygalactose transaminase